MLQIHKTSFVAKSAVIIGDVTIGKHCGVYPQAVIRGDENSIVISDGSNVQDCCVIHVDINHNVEIGKNVSLGHSSMIHGAIIGDNCLIGIHATVLNGARIGSGSIIGANALVTANMEIPENSMVLGIPGKIVKQDVGYTKIAQENAESYKKLTFQHKKKEFIIYNGD